MPIYQVYANDTNTVTINFLDELGITAIPQPNYPKVFIKEGNSILSTELAIATGNPDEYEADITVPDNIFDFEDKDFIGLKVVWELLNTDDTTYIVNQVLQLLPREDQKDVIEDIMIISRNDTIQITVPFLLDFGTDSACLNIYDANKQLNTNTITPFDMVVRGESTALLYSIENLANVIDRLEHYNIIVSGFKDAVAFAPRYIRLFYINPSIMAAASMIEDQIHKSRQQDIIPQLDYTQVDLIHYLQRGLDMYNAYPPIITAFTGRNMLGVIREGWIISATYYALSAQFLAESDLAFNFSGPGVSFDIDRSGAIETALGRLNDAMDRFVRPSKQLLGKRGTIGGDGDIMGTGDGTSMGVVGIGRHYLSYRNAGYGNRRLNRYY